MNQDCTKWSESSKKLIKELQKELWINHENWHTQKSDNKKRAAEQLVGALSQLIHNGDTDNVKDLISHSLKWLNKEVQDPGCPKT